MANPIKTLILRTIKTELENIMQDDGITPLFTKVLRNPSKPIDHDYFKSPMCFIFDEPGTIIWRNRMADCTTPIQIEAWIKAPDKAAEGLTQDEEMSDDMDILEAEIHKAFQSSTAIKTYGSIAPEQNNPGTRFFIDEFLGGIVVRYTLKWLFEWGDPYNSGRQ